MSHMESLRRAAPVAAPAIDRDALFARIVAQPGDTAAEAAVPSRRSPRRKLVVALVAIVVATLTAGTALATGFLGWHDETAIVQQPNQWSALYRAATRKLTLPPGESWPLRTLAPNTVTSPGQPGGEAVAIAIAFAGSATGPMPSAQMTGPPSSSRGRRWPIS
jgi:hypothetical protein